MNKLALYDTECVKNYWLLKFRPIGQKSIVLRLLAGQSFDAPRIQLIQYLFKEHTSISFNGINYDVAMITAAISGYTPERLKVINDRMIVEKIKHWQLGLPKWEPADHIDLIEVAPGAGSLKQYAGRIHSKKIQDLPYPPDKALSNDEIEQVELYCENDLDVLEDLWNALQPQIEQRIALSERYGIDLRSKSDAQLAETVLKSRCEAAVGQRIYKRDVDYNMTWGYTPPNYIAFELPQLRDALDRAKESVFSLSASGTVEMPSQLEGLEVTVGLTTYTMGIGGLHSQDKRAVYRSDERDVLLDRDVARYYPQLMINSGRWPTSLGPNFIESFKDIADERLTAKRTLQNLKKLGITSGDEYSKAKVGDDGGKIMINGTFGKCGSQYSILFAPEMLIQTTLTGQLSLLMLIEWHEHYGIPVVSANTDGIVIKCPRDKVSLSEALVHEWENRTGLEMETVEYRSIYSRDVNNYFAVKSDGKVKRKGEYAISGLVEKKNPDSEICSDAVAAFIADGIPLMHTLAECRDIRKFVTIQKVSGGGVKMWGEGPRKNTKVRDMLNTLLANGWVKSGRYWVRHGMLSNAHDAYTACFKPQVPEYLGKVVRWYYAINSPGPIVYANADKVVSLSYGAKPCMTLPDDFPTDIDYDWYLKKCLTILNDVGYSDGVVNN